MRTFTRKGRRRDNIAALVFIVGVILLYNLIGLGVEAAFGAHGGTVWRTDANATRYINADVTPMDDVLCVGYGHRAAGTQKHRRFSCVGSDGVVTCTFDVRLTMRGPAYNWIDCRG